MSLFTAFTQICAWNGVKKWHFTPKKPALCYIKNTQAKVSTKQNHVLWPCFIKIQFKNELLYLLSVLLCPKDSKVMVENMLGDKNSCISSPKTDKTTQKYMIFLIWKCQYSITHSCKSIVSYIKWFWSTSRESACVIAKPYI